MRHLSICASALLLSACLSSSNDDSYVSDVISHKSFKVPATNAAPVADAGVDKNVAAGSTVSLDASGSSDIDSDILFYDWSTEITTATISSAALSETSIVNPSFTTDEVGTYRFQVAVSDGIDTVTDEVTITVTAGTATGEGTTVGIECDYSSSTYNDSDSVNLASLSDWTCTDTTRELTANGVPDHAVGTFPNAGNPHTISEAEVAISYPLAPVLTDKVIALGDSSGAQGYMLMA